MDTSGVKGMTPEALEEALKQDMKEPRSGGPGRIPVPPDSKAARSPTEMSFTLADIQTATHTLKDLEDRQNHAHQRRAMAFELMRLIVGSQDFNPESLAHGGRATAIARGCVEWVDALNVALDRNEKPAASEPEKG